LRSDLRAVAGLDGDIEAGIPVEAFLNRKLIAGVVAGSREVQLKGDLLKRGGERSRSQRQYRGERCKRQISMLGFCRYS